MQKAEVKQLIGNLDLDSPSENIGKGYHRIAWNGIFRGNPGNMRFEGAVGNTLVPNALLPGSGVNKTINAYYDTVNQRVFLFNYNSAGNHGIYIYYTLTKSFIRLIQTGVNTVGDPLAFTANGRINSVDIIYGDGVSGDLLFFIDSIGRPRKFNINRILAGGYASVKDNYLKVIKAPPIGPPQCVYENDTTVSANNLINSLFNIAATHLYDDYEESVLGSGAKQPLPSDPFDPTNNVDKSRNARIAIYVPTGDANVKKIRLYGKQVKDGATSDWFIIDTLNKADLGIPDNTVYRYLFYNNGSYIAVDPKFTVLDFDYVPLVAKCGALLDGSVPAYAAITEGFNYFNPSFNILTQNTNQPLYSVNGTLFFAATNGVFTGSQPQVTVYLTGVGVNDGFGNPTILEKPPGLVVVRAKSNVSDISFSYINASSFTSIASILSGLQAAAVTAGWTISSTSANSFTAYYPTGNVVLQSSYLQGLGADNSPYLSPISAHYPESAQSYGTLYRDGDGRTNGVISNVTGNIKTQTIGAAGQIPEVLISLSGFTPPAWAVYYEIVRTDTLTYNKYLDWVSGSAYSNKGQLVDTKYAYFGISNISDYNTSIKATEGVIGYGFTPGDRIRVKGRFDVNGAFVALNLDYAILGVSINPVVGGVTQIGSFIQIAYPTNDIGADFKFDGTTDFQNYSILIYSYKSYSPTNNNVYFQVGQQYGIGNPGTNAAYHMGNVGDNQVNLTEGDIFFRKRTVPIGSTFYINTGSFTQNTTYSTLWVNPGGGAIPISDNTIWSIIGGLPQPAGLLPVQYPNYGSTDWTIKNKSANPFNVRLRGTIPVIDNGANGQFAMYVKVAEPGNVITTYNILPLKTGLVNAAQNFYDFDATISLPPNGQLWIMNYAVNAMLIGGFTLRLDIIRGRTIEVFDASFSDIYNLKTNSDNKPNIVDTTARQTFFSTLFRFAQPYVLGTNINNSNRFYFNNFDEFDKSFGSVMRMTVNLREVILWQERKCGRINVYAKFIKDNNGANTLVTTDTIITPNNIEYYQGSFGVGNQPDGICSIGFQHYFADPVKGYLCRLSSDGIQPISELFHVQTFAGNSLPNYLNNYNYQFGGNAVILAVYNFCKDRDSEVIFAMQGGTNGGQSIPSQMLSFVERRNGFGAFYNDAPDALVCAENLLISFKNGQLYTHDNTTAYANLYGVQYYPSLNLIFNDQVLIKKTFDALGYQGNQIWESPFANDIITSQPNQQTGLPQISTLTVSDYITDEAIRKASFNRDINSMANPQVALWEGDYLKGGWINCNFTYRGSGFGWINSPYIKYSLSPKNL